MRLERVQREIGELDGVVITNPIDLLYMVGIPLSSGKLLVTPDGAQLFVDRRYTTVCNERSPFPLGETFPEGLRLGFDSRTTPYAEAPKGGVPLDGFMARVRSIKEPDEVAQMRKAAELNRASGEFLMGRLRTGVSEAELAAELQIYWLENGGEGPSFEPIVAFGESSALPHHRPGKRRLQEGDWVLLDCGVQLGFYQSDRTIVQPYGEVDPKLLEIRDIVAEAVEAALAVARPGVQLCEVDGAARDLIEKAGYELPHGLGHGVGLEVHEEPRLRKESQGTLEEGMMVTVEPGIYLPGLGGVRLEETYLVGREGLDEL